MNCPFCGKLFSSSSSLWNHKRLRCKNRPHNINGIIHEPDEIIPPQQVPAQQVVEVFSGSHNNKKTIEELEDEYDDGGYDDDEVEVEQEPEFNSSYSFTFKKAPTRQQPPQQQKQPPQQTYSTYSTKLPPKPEIPKSAQFFESAQFFDSQKCQNLHNKITKLLERDDVQSAVTAGKLVLEDRVTFQNYVNYCLPVVEKEQEECLTRKNEMERLLGIDAQQLAKLKHKVAKVHDKKDLERIHNYFKFGKSSILILVGN